MSDAELSREKNDLYFGAGEPTSYGDYGAGSTAKDPRDDDETGRFAVVVTDPGGEERDRSTWTTRSRADRIAAHHREALEVAGSPASVEVIDLTEESNASR